MEIKHIELKPFTWIHPQLSLISRCDLDVYMGVNSTIAIATEREDNYDVGIGITEGAQMIAAVIMHKYGISPEALTWIEHHTGNGQNCKSFEERYDLVKFDFNGTGLNAPSRDSIDKKAVEALIK
ncbi:MAG: hypothetical protein JRG68_09795 [Deltaproteobacteria bacterium]|nr:hypothetical protein [Deltaproteobacteria bacterium]